jgi:hypothetical protein
MNTLYRVLIFSICQLFISIQFKYDQIVTHKMNIAVRYLSSKSTPKRFITLTPGKVFNLIGKVIIRASIFIERNSLMHHNHSFGQLCQCFLPPTLLRWHQLCWTRTLYLVMMRRVFYNCAGQCCQH